ncbi:helix-turn-helix domain-containing protein [Streptomyces sp. TR06-5]|uniref:helix-turn-helix domain-containing protein n=1 Tax=unclassified Streptomyces TaxID=2593676 RepID=UPI0039A1B384
MAPGRRVVSPAGQYFAEVLRLTRGRAGLSQSELGSRMSYTGAAVSAVETCAKPATDEFVDAAEKALDAGGVLRAARRYLRLERYPEHFQGFVQLEQEALSLTSFCSQVIHGLLQTEGYARAVLASGFPPLDESDLEALTAARMERAALLTRKPFCVINVVLDEAVLRRHVGTARTMTDQFDHLLACSELPNVVVQVMPVSRGVHAGLEGPFTVIETPECDRLVYMECNGNSTLVARPEEVGVYARRCAMIGQQALRPEESFDLIKELAGGE